MKAETEDMMVSALQRIGAELQSGYSAGKEFVSEQAPEVAREIVAWGIASNVIWAVFYAVGCALMAYATVRAWRYLVDEGCSAEPMAMFPAAATVACFVGMFYYAAAAAEVGLAPRVYLLKQGAAIAKGKF